MTFRSVRAVCFLAGLFATSAAYALELQQQSFSDDEIFTAVVERFKRPLMYRFNPRASGERKPVLVLGPALKYGREVESKSFVHLSRQDLVAQQLAVFILVKKSHPDLKSEVLYVHYEIPSNASFGVLKVFPKDGALVAEEVESFRSSSGARVAYGELYEHTTCRDGTEMAYRWNMQERSAVDGRCPEKIFTEFTQWLELSRKLNKP